MKKFLPYLFLYLSAVSVFAFFQLSGILTPSDELNSDDEAMAEGVSTPEYQIPEIPTFEPDATLIGTWNLRLKPPPAFMRPGDYHDPILIAQIIIDSGADLWGLQEMFDDYSDSAEQLRNEYMDAVVLILNRRTKQEWQYWVGDVEHTWGQNTGFLWNTKTVEVLQEPWVINDFERIKVEATDRRVWSRRPTAAVFRYKSTGTRLLIISAHHKGYNSEESQTHRNAEALVLIEALAKIKRNSAVDGVVILGRLADEAEEPCSLTYAEAGFRDLNPTDRLNLMSADEDGSVELGWAPARILVDSLSSKIFPDSEVATLGDAWLAERKIDLHNFIYYASNYLPLVTRVE